MAKKSSTETKTLKDSCVGPIKELEGGGFTCKNKDGKQITCLPSHGTTSSCWITNASLNTDALKALVQAQLAIDTAIEEIVEPKRNEKHSKY